MRTSLGRTALAVPGPNRGAAFRRGVKHFVPDRIVGQRLWI